MHHVVFIDSSAGHLACSYLWAMNMDIRMVPLLLRRLHSSRCLPSPRNGQALLSLSVPALGQNPPREVDTARNQAPFSELPFSLGLKALIALQYLQTGGFCKISSSFANYSR